MTTQPAEVTTLTATVRVLSVGNRQITTSVAKQLDEGHFHIEDAFGRIKLPGVEHFRWCPVASREIRHLVLLIGPDMDDGSLVIMRVHNPRWGRPPGAYSQVDGAYGDFITALQTPLIVLAGLR